MTAPPDQTGYDPERRFSAGLRWFNGAALGAALLLGIGSYGHLRATQVYFGEAAVRGDNTLRLAIATLRGELAAYQQLPRLIADQQILQGLVADPGNPDLVATSNRYLRGINALLGSSDIYVMDRDGKTLAASNFDQDISFIGHNFAYRPYFYQALAGGEGRFYALGTTSLKRGYYFGSPIRVQGVVQGVVVFKIDMDAIEQSWRGSDYAVAVTDPEGIIFLSSRPGWLFHSILPLTKDRLARTAVTRRYADATLRELDFSEDTQGGGQRLLTISSGESTEFLVLAAAMPEAGWTVKVLLDTASARSQARTMVFVLMLAMGLGGMGVVIWLQRRAGLAARMQMQRAAQAELEHRVAERTTELALVNRQLEGEVAERRAAESDLRKAQDDLVQAGKMAALGQMSAALSHEFNQPLGAARNYADNALILIDRDRIAEARDNIGRVLRLVDRMASISRHLRNFARKPDQKLGPVLLDEVFAATQEIIAWRLTVGGASLVVDLGPTPLWVLAGPVRLQQVLVNILSNAVDAVEHLPDRQISVTARQKGGRVGVEIRDHGPGVAPGLAERIFDPFFSTKGVGKGLGLGLSISYNIVRDFGGSVRATNHPDGGALFVVDLVGAPAPAARVAE